MHLVTCICFVLAWWCSWVTCSASRQYHLRAGKHRLIFSWHWKCYTLIFHSWTQYKSMEANRWGWLFSSHQAKDPLPKCLQGLGFSTEWSTCRTSIKENKKAMPRWNPQTIFLSFDILPSSFFFYVCSIQ